MIALGGLVELSGFVLLDPIILLMKIEGIHLNSNNELIRQCSCSHTSDILLNLDRILQN